MAKLLITVFFYLSAVCAVSFAAEGPSEYLRTRSGSLAAQDAAMQARENVVPEYFIAPADEIEIFVWQDLEYGEPEKKEPGSGQRKYRIGPGDGIEIFVWQNPDLSKDVIVGPDGEISMPLIGRVRTAGLTTEELEKNISEELTQFVKSPQVSIMIKQFGSNKISGGGNTIIDQLNTMKDYVIDPDGKISYPYVGRVQAAGLSISQFQNELQKNLIKFIESPQVAVTIKKASGNKVIILGEVAYPGTYTYRGEISLIDLVALAGDFNQKAHSDSVIVVHGNFSGRPQVRRINMTRVITRGHHKEDIMLQPNDVVYVPQTFVGNLVQCMNDLSQLITNAQSALQIRNTIRTQIQGHKR